MEMTAITKDPTDPTLLMHDLTLESKCTVLNSIWGSNFKLEDFIREPQLAESYFAYYHDQCRTALHSKRLNTIIKSHSDIVDIVTKLKTMNARRHDLKDSLSVLVVDLVERDGDTLVCEAIDLAARLWIMVDIGQLSWGFVPGQKSMQWEDGKLTELLHNRFGDPGPSKLGIRVKLERLFTARNLERIAGLQIVWTSNLSDHLKLKDDDTRVAIFYHATFLKHHNKECHPFPPGFFEETERTLALLIPQYDINSTRWFKIQQRKFGLDYMASSTGHLTTEERQIENFVFWHDRLCILKQVFDEAEPGTIAQWWCDRRRRVQWYTFWVAALVLALTIFFGMIQCVEGGLQVYKAYYPS